MSSDSRNRWALLIGINEYPLLKPRGQLTGCVNDVEVMSRTLQQQFGFPGDHMTILRNAEATRDGILAAMNGLMERVGKDDVVVFHYSGHGSRMTDREGDEEDGFDETIMPCDSGRREHPNRDITDDEIYLWLQKLTAVTPYVTLIFDCCHSGTIVRGELDVTNTDMYVPEGRWFDPDDRLVSQLPPSPVGSLARSALEGSSTGPSGWLPLGERYAVIAGCSAKECSYEVQVGGESAGVRHGALTHFLTQELVKARSGFTYRDIFERCSPRVTALYPQQHPQLEGAWDREIFGIRTIEPMVFVGVRERTGDRVTLDAGASCGLTAGSRWAVYPSGTKRVDDEVKSLGLIEISTVRAVTSEAKVVEETGPGAVAVGTRAVEQDHCVGETRLKVEVVAGEDPWRSSSYVLGRIDQSKLLRRALPEETADIQVRILPAGHHLAGGEESWLAVAPDGTPLFSPRRRSDFDAVDRLLEDLENEARTRRVLDLRNDGSALTGWVDFKLLRRLAHDRFEEPELDEDGEPVFFDGDQIVLEITNRHDLPLFFYVLNLGVSGAVGLMYPVRGAQKPLAPGMTFRPGSRNGDEIDLSISGEILQLWSKLERSSLEGREVMKLFATTHEADFSSLFKPGHRRSGGSNSLDDVLAATFGGGYRDARVRNQELREDWITIERGYRLRAGARLLAAAV